MGDGAAGDGVVGLQSGIVSGENMDVRGSSGVVTRESGLEEADTIGVGLSDAAVEGRVLSIKME
jgi:hypothetical protein